jgi:hypothetical protein
VGLPCIDVPQAIFEIIGRAGQISAEKQDLPRMGKTSLLSLSEDRIAVSGNQPTSRTILATDGTPAWLKTNNM